MWIAYAFLSAFFAGLTTILAKVGVKNTNSHLLTALRTMVVLIFAWLMVFIAGSSLEITSISIKSLSFLILSGLTTGGSWICYFRALQLGDVNKVVPIDKSSTVLTMVLAFAFLGENITYFKVGGMLLLTIGTYLMIQKKASNKSLKTNNRWFIYAILSALFASLTSILGKVGIENVEVYLGIAIRTTVVLVMAWVIVFHNHKHLELKQIDKRSWLFILLSGLATGLSWLFYYRALKEGQASIVVPIDKLSIFVTILFSYFFLKEKLNKKSFIGLLLIIVGTLTLLIKI